MHRRTGVDRGRVARGLLVSAVAFAPLGATGCEQILGIDKHTSHAAEAPDATVGGDDGGMDASLPPCVLPSIGDAQLRVGNFIASPSRYDVCMHRTDGTSPIDDAPIVASSSSTCPNGLAYKEMTAPFATPGGTYTLVAVAAGAGCASTPIATMAALSLSANQPTMALLLGTDAAPRLLTLHESRPQRLNTDLRFVHAITGAPPLDLGFLDAPGLPAMLQGIFFSDVTFGAIALPGFPDGGTASVDMNGYVEVSAPGGTLAFGAASTGQRDASLAINTHLAGNDSYTMLAIGIANDPRFPEELVICDEGKNDGIYTRCGGGPPVDVTIDTINTYLWGPFATLEPERHDAAIAAVAALQSDVVCVTETWSDDDKRAIIAAAKTRFPYSLMFADTLTTSVDDPADQNGNTPPAPTIAACAGGPQARLDAFLDCARDKCSKQLGDENAPVIDDAVTCLTASCQSVVTPLLFGNDQTKACWSCAVTSLEGSATIGATRTACTTDPNQRYAFGGASSLLILSRFPIGATEQWVLPSTEWRSSVLRAEIAVPGGASIDAYCTEITSPQSGLTHPYVGAYGGGATDSDTEWLNEQTLQAKKLAAYVTRRSGAVGRRAVLSGEMYAGPTVANVLDPINADAFSAISGPFPEAARADYTPACTFCADNTLTTPPGQSVTALSTWTSSTFLVNMPITDVVSSTITLKDATISYSTYQIPVSPYYGYRAVVRVRP